MNNNDYKHVMSFPMKMQKLDINKDQVLSSRIINKPAAKTAEKKHDPNCMPYRRLSIS